VESDWIDFSFLLQEITLSDLVHIAAEDPDKARRLLTQLLPEGIDSEKIMELLVSDGTHQLPDKMI
jgi:hypothetical protein